MVKRKVGTGGDYPDAWKPEPGDRVVGEITRKERARTEYGETGVLEIDDEAGPVTVFCGSAVLSRVWDDVELGDVLDLTYEGEKLSEKSGRTFKSYLAEVDDGELVAE